MIWNKVNLILIDQNIVIQDITKCFLTLLITRNNLNYIHNIIATVDSLLDKHDNIHRFDIISPTTIETKVKKNMHTLLSEMVNGKVLINILIDPTLLSGIIIKFNNKILDLSAKGAITMLRKQIN